MALIAAQDLHDTTRMIAEVGIEGLGMPDCDYYLRDEPRFKDARGKYIAYMRQVLTLAGVLDADASAAVAAAMKIETALAQAGLSRVELRDPKVQDHPMTFAELKTLAPRFDWYADFRALGVPPEGRLNVPQPKLVQAFDGLLGSLPIDVWRSTCAGSCSTARQPGCRPPLPARDSPSTGPP